MTFLRNFMLGLIGSVGVAQAATIETELVRGDFVFEHSTVAPGDETTLALDMALEPGWHTYWKNAGDSGQPVEIKWDLPDGVTVGEMSWPAPHRQPFEPMMNYGYEDSSTLLMPVSVPADWPVGKPVKMTADVFWLVCKDVCIPEQGITTLSLPTGAQSSMLSSDTEAKEALFTAARAAIPTTVPYSTTYQVDDTHVMMRFASGDFANAALKDAYVFPSEWGVIDHAGIQVASVDSEGLTLKIPRSPENDVAPTGTVSGLIEITETAGAGDVQVAMAFDAVPGVITAPSGGGFTAAEGVNAQEITFLAALGFAFLGGLILNLMPCVFPVLALKALSFAEMSDSSFRHRAVHGLAYTAGVIVLFLLLAVGFLGLRAAGEAIGWGFQLQNPYIVAALAYLLFIIALNLSGVFEVSSRFAGVGSQAADSGGARGAFFTGALTAIVATPCTAPFMGTAMGATLTLPSGQSVLVFVALALGLAAPFLFLSLSPAAARLLPAPGIWMVRLKEFLAFPMYATAALLVWVLGGLVGADAMLAAMIGGVLIGLAAWAYGASQHSGARGQKLGLGTAVVSMCLALFMITQMREAPEGVGEAFSADRLAELRADGKPVFINMTADWCITCKVNERVALQGAFEQALDDNDVTYLLGDWTAYDADITHILEKFGRAGVPLYAVYPRTGDPVLLPQLLTSDMLVDALGKV